MYENLAPVSGLDGHLLVYQLPALFKHKVTPFGLVPVRSAQCTDEHAVGIRQKVVRKVFLYTRESVRRDDGRRAHLGLPFRLGGR